MYIYCKQISNSKLLICFFSLIEGKDLLQGSLELQIN